jgi:signal transduction histidine kinase
VLLGLLGLALGHVATQERTARTRAERLRREVEATMARLVRAERLAAVGRLSAKMAHEIRNPLGAITLNVDMLGDLVGDCPGPAMGEARELLRGIREELGALTTLTEEYLIAGRLPRPRLAEDSLNDLVQEMVEFTRPVAERQGVRLTLDLDASLPLVAFDREMIRQVLRNLAKNSLEALPRGGHLHFRTRRDEDTAAIAVIDDGPGISADTASRLFEPFFTTKARGTGLGLSIARQIAGDHGGELTWSSTPGAGATFSVRLPLTGAICG